MTDTYRTGRIMVWHGGGSRGYLSALMTEYINNRLGIPQDKIYEHADVMAGTSTGALQAACYSFGLTPLIAQQLYLDVSKRLFTSRAVSIGCNTDLDSNKLNLAQKAAFIGLNEPFYESPCPIEGGNSNFGSNVLQAKLIEVFGDYTMQDLKTNIVIPALDESNKKYSYFSNNHNPFFIGQDYKIRDVLRATSAAPLYLPSWQINGSLFGDGGVFDNNPVPMAARCLKTIKPRYKRLFIISYGTGIGEYGFHGTPTDVTQTSIQKLISLYTIASTGGQEISSMQYIFDRDYTIDETNILNLQPILDPNIDTEIDTSSDEFYNYLRSVFNQYKADNMAEIDDFVLRWNI
jgi:Patatin-like phospholipase